MTTDADTGRKSGAKPGTPPGRTAAARTAAAGEAAEPIVLEKKKKRRTTRGSRGLQNLERGLSRSAGRVADAVAKGVDEYRDRSDRSARKKRDGALRDLSKNLSRGLDVGLREAAKAPYDLARRIKVRDLIDPLRLFR